jgi:hypothetical protein
MRQRTETIMNTRKIVVGGIACAAAVGAVLGVSLQAHAASAAKPMKAAPAAAQPAGEPTTPDTDNLQQGDQNTPDTGSVAAPTLVTSGTAAKESSSENTTESASAEASSESETASDGPGGHADPAGDVQHEGGANEQ